MTDRTVPLAGAPNTRDVGGLVNRYGRLVRPGRLLRSGALGRLIDADVAVLSGYRLRQVLDLRHDREIAVAPPDLLPDGAVAVHLPIYDPEHPVFTYVSAVMLGHDISAYSGLVADGTPAAMRAIYRWFVSGASARTAFAAALRRVADPASLPLLYHCSAGKDRTGWLTALVLTVLDVDRAVITEDYLLSNERSATVNEKIMRAVAARGAELDHVRPVLEVRPDYLDAAYDEADRVYGGIDGYLRAGLGLDDATLARLRAALLD
ncbi:MAG TPA: tyrosine-protein phosphatase [Micromonosporaceae bacterium]